MTPFDLVFIVVVLATVVSLGSFTVTAARGRREAALLGLRRLAIGLVAYMGVVTLVSLIEPRRVVELGEDQCSDDWCVAVMSAEASPRGPDVTVEVGFRLNSRALRVNQRERFVVAYLVDSEGTRYDAAQVSGEVPFDTLLAPGEAVNASRTFRVGAGTSDLAVVVAREGDFAFPRCCIIGQGPFFRYPIVRIPD